MKSLRQLICLGGCIVLSARSLAAQEQPTSIAPAAFAEENRSPSPATSVAEQPWSDPLGPGAAGAEQSRSFLFPPPMFGDLLAIESVRQAGGGFADYAGVALRGAFKISDNESPRPLDRVFVTGNDFGNVNQLFLGPGASFANVYREMIGFEKTFLNGDASIGMRLPFFQLTGAPGRNETVIGDVSVILKYALINDPAGHVLSGGLVATAPTGPGLHITGQSEINPVILQPWLGDIWTYKDLFVQGFVSLAVPTDARDEIYFFKSIGAGYWLYRTNDPNRLLSAIVPDAEFHLTDPLNHRGLNTFPIGFPFLIDFTGGLYVFLRRAVLGVSVGTPLTGPKPYEYMVNTTLNFRF